MRNRKHLTNNNENLIHPNSLWSDSYRSNVEKLFWVITLLNQSVWIICSWIRPVSKVQLNSFFWSVGHTNLLYDFRVSFKTSFIMLLWYRDVILRTLSYTERNNICPFFFWFWHFIVFQTLAARDKQVMNNHLKKIHKQLHFKCQTKVWFWTTLMQWADKMKRECIIMFRHYSLHALPKWDWKKKNEKKNP